MEKYIFRGNARERIEFEDGTSFVEENDVVVGNLVYYEDCPYIVGDFVEVDGEYTVLEYWVPVKKETLGQYIGVNDENGVYLFEGDKVKFLDLKNNTSSFGVIKFDGGSFYIKNPFMSNYRLYDYKIKKIDELKYKIIEFEYFR